MSTAHGKIMHEGAEPEPFTETSWLAHCACSRVFVAASELACSAAYLAHLPKPGPLPAQGRVTKGSAT